MGETFFVCAPFSAHLGGSPGPPSGSRRASRAGLPLPSPTMFAFVFACALGAFRGCFSHIFDAPWLVLPTGAAPRALRGRKEHPTQPAPLGKTDASVCNLRACATETYRPRLWLHVISHGSSATAPRGRPGGPGGKRERTRCSSGFAGCPTVRLPTPRETSQGAKRKRTGAAWFPLRTSSARPSS